MEHIHALTLRQMKLLEILGDVQSLQVAASLLSITQSSATKSLQKVESLLDTQLFHRTNKGLLPTRAGLIFIGHASTMLRTAERAQRDLQNLKNGREGELRIGAPSGASRAALQKAILHHSTAYSNIAINVKEASSVELHTLLVGREIDCIVGRRAGQFDIPGIEFISLYTEIFCLCVRPEHPFAAQPSVKLSDLASLNWILPPTEMRARRAIDASFTDCGSTPPARFVETLGVQGMELLLGSDMVGIWPYQAIRKPYLVGSISILNIALPRTVTQIGLSRVDLEHRPKFFDDFCVSVQNAGQEIDRDQTEWRALFSM